MYDGNVNSSNMMMFMLRGRKIYSAGRVKCVSIIEARIVRRGTVIRIHDVAFQTVTELVSLIDKRSALKIQNTPF